MIDGCYENYRELVLDCIVMGVEPEHFLNEIKRCNIVFPPDIQAKIDEIEAKTKQDEIKVLIDGIGTD